MQRDLARIQELFHGLIRSRCAEGGIKVPEELPSLANLKVSDKETYFPVEGMYGGFSFKLEERDGEPCLIGSSWVRVVEGSGMRHLITPKQVLPEDEGFV